MVRRIVLLSLAALGMAGLAIAQEAAAPVVTESPVTIPTVKMGDLPSILDKPATFEDAVADEAGVKRMVHMGGLDKITARTFKFEAPVGHTVRFKKLLITARTCFVRPPEETPETSVFIEIAEPTAQGGDTLQRLFSGWMFASSPGLNALEHPVYDVWVIGCQVDDPANPMAASEEAPTDQVEAEKPSVDDTIEDDDAARE